MPHSKQPSKISILIAARNEEANIARCLTSIDQLNFPKSNFEILIGDDGSTDATAEIIKSYICNKPEFKYILIDRQLVNLKGKANVLAHLAQVADGEYYFFCDADIAVNTEWLNAMSAEFSKKTGVVVGVTRMNTNNFFADLLSLEWMQAMLITRFFSLFKIPITGLGNNMAVSRKAYEAIGGYEKLGFSVVEDYSLFMAVVKKGFEFEMCYKTEVLSYSEPLDSFKAWVAQRTRWMQGVMLSTWTTQALLILTALLVPFLVLLAIWQPVLAFWLFLAHYSFVTLLSIISVVILRQKDLWKSIPFFWFYLSGSTTLMLFNYFKSNKVSWKGRDY